MQIFTPILYTVFLLSGWCLKHKFYFWWSLMNWFFLLSFVLMIYLTNYCLNQGLEKITLYSNSYISSFSCCVYDFDPFWFNFYMMWYGVQLNLFRNEYSLVLVSFVENRIIYTLNCFDTHFISQLTKVRFYFRNILFHLSCVST